MSIERRRVYYSGRVQGVGFRMTARRLARPFGLAGFARNLPDGRVEVQAQGEADRVVGFLGALSSEMGPNIVHAEEDRFDPDPDLPPEFAVRS